ncbi:MAG: hypothetical protein OXT65_10635 [Alphaproteobacteria bacterium]|nr:hypothetical protein [Alphaproteobacteria bacterium]
MRYPVIVAAIVACLMLSSEAVAQYDGVLAPENPSSKKDGATSYSFISRPSTHKELSVRGKNLEKWRESQAQLRKSNMAHHAKTNKAFEESAARARLVNNGGDADYQARDNAQLRAVQYQLQMQQAGRNVLGETMAPPHRPYLNYYK